MVLWLKLPEDWAFIWEIRGILDLRLQILDLKENLQSAILKFSHLTAVYNLLNRYL